MKIDPSRVARVYVKDEGWIDIQSMREETMSLTTDAQVHQRRMKRGWQIVDADGGQLWLTAAMIEGVEVQ